MQITYAKKTSVLRAASYKWLLLADLKEGTWVSQQNKLESSPFSDLFTCDNEAAVRD